VVVSANPLDLEAGWQQVPADAQNTWQASPRLTAMPSNIGVRVFDMPNDDTFAR
jgi:hypothetical protein